MRRKNLVIYEYEHNRLSKKGNYISPMLVTLKQELNFTKEIFGSILHVAKFSLKDLDLVLHGIRQMGYCLTLGIQIRIDSRMRYIREKMPLGNCYVNRKMIGAVVGLQPFGGEGLSGTGPKAGGEDYLRRICVERTITLNNSAIGGDIHLLSDSN